MSIVGDDTQSTLVKLLDGLPVHVVETTELPRNFLGSFRSLQATGQYTGDAPVDHSNAAEDAGGKERAGSNKFHHTIIVCFRGNFD